MLSDRRARRIAGLQHRRGRAKHDQFLVEGVRSVEEALRAEWPLGEVLADPASLDDRGRAAWDTAGARGIERIEVPADTLTALATTTTPQPILATAARPEGDLEAGGPGHLLVVDGVQDPGNAGGIIRVAHAYAIGTVVFLKGAADPFNPKVVRGSMGSIFHVALAWDVELDALVAAFDRHEIRLVATVAHDGEADERGANPEIRRTAFAVGSEGHGVSDRLRDAADVSLTLRLPGAAESLNVVVATAVLLDRHLLPLRAIGPHRSRE